MSDLELDPALKAQIDNHEVCTVCHLPLVSNLVTIRVQVAKDGGTGQGEFPIHAGNCLELALHHMEHDPTYRVEVVG